MKKTELVALALLTVASIARAGVQMSETFQVAAGAEDATHSRFEPAVAFGAGGYLVVWRSGLANREARIFAARLDSNGRTLDPKGIALADDTMFQQEPTVAFGNDVFLVVFTGIKGKKGADGLLQSGVFGVRVSAEGKVLDAKPFPIGDAPGHQSQPAVAFDGTNFRVVWVARLDSDSYRGEFKGLSYKGLLEIRTSRVSTGGKLLDPPPGILAARESRKRKCCYQPAIACADGKVMVACFDGNIPQAVLFGVREGGPRSAGLDAWISLCQWRKGLKSPSRIRRPALASSGKGFLAVWEDERTRGEYGTPWNGMLFDLTGKTLDPDGIIPAAGKNKSTMVPAVAFDGQAYVWVWIDYFKQSLMSNRVSTTGKTLERQDVTLVPAKRDKDGRPLLCGLGAPVLASDGDGRVLLVCQKYAAAASERVQIVGSFIKK